MVFRISDNTERVVNQVQTDVLPQVSQLTSYFIEPGTMQVHCPLQSAVQEIKTHVDDVTTSLADVAIEVQSLQDARSETSLLGARVDQLEQNQQTQGQHIDHAITELEHLALQVADLHEQLNQIINYY